ncbi:MAG: hypothetical protein GX262_07965 [Clostridia bacterium]|jgi:hypothetical protein|nr:hypothetical protein [Clostridia bacterium]
MKLAPGEHSILASFATNRDAQTAAKELIESGITEVQVDRVSAVGANNNSVLNNLLSGKPGSLTGVTLYGGQDNPNGDNVGVLQAADPSVSGMATPEDGLAGGEGFLLTVVTRGQLLNQALKIIESHGGVV